MAFSLQTILLIEFFIILLDIFYLFPILLMSLRLPLFKLLLKLINLFILLFNEVINRLYTFILHNVTRLLLIPSLKYDLTITFSILSFSALTFNIRKFLGPSVILVLSNLQTFLVQNVIAYFLSHPCYLKELNMIALDELISLLDLDR